MKTMSMMDGLTGLLNRNSYDARLASLEEKDFRSLACVYIDVDGLHEVNNHLGHEAGDRMLQRISREITNAFGRKDTYRIGGDEFVVLCKNLKREQVEQRAVNVKMAVKQREYHCSVGIEWREQDIDIREIVKTAEKRMMQEKRNYYEEQGDVRSIRGMNLQLEKMLAEKQDAEAFLSVIASNFKGVYFVNMSKDSVRHIYIPEYFEDMLCRSGGKFSKAIRLYGEEAVDEEFSKGFVEFCNYEYLEDKLKEEKVPELTYEKKDGTWLCVRVFKFRKYTGDKKETLWIFEYADAPLRQRKNDRSSI